MSLKEKIQLEKTDLMQNKRPYETAAFIIFSVLFLQQVFYLLRAITQFMKKTNTFFNSANITNIANNQGFFNRIVGIDLTSWMYVLLAIAALVFYYFLIYIFVWNYCKKRGHAKWTWTLIVVFGPYMFLAPAYIWYVLYVFRPYIFRFMKKGFNEFKSFNPDHKFEEETDSYDYE